MHLQRIIHTIILLIGLTVPAGWAATADVHFNEALMRLPSKTLLERGIQYTQPEHSKPDSAMLCYTAITSRRDKMDGDTAQLRVLTKALINISYLDTEHYHDISDAFVNLLEAIDLAETHGFADLLPYAYLNMAVVYNTASSMDGPQATKGNDSRIFDYLWKAYEKGLAAGKQDVVTQATCYLATIVFAGSDTAAAKNLVERLVKSAERANLSADTRLLTGALNDYICGRLGPAADKLKKILADRGTLMSPYLIRYYLSSVYLKEGSVEESRHELDELEKEIGSMGTAANKVWLAGILAEFYKRTGDQVQADRYELEYYRLREQYAAAGSIMGTESLGFRREVSDFRDQLVASRQREQTSRMWILVAAVVVLALIAVLVMTVRYHRRRFDYINALYRKSLQPQSQHPVSVKPTVGERERELAQRIVDVVNTSDEVLSPDFNMTRLSELVDSNTTYVSKAVNSVLGKNVKALLAERRIREACRRLSDPALSRRLTIEALGVEVGFKSRSAFLAAFKEITGLSPSDYRKAAAQSRNEAQ